MARWISWAVEIGRMVAGSRTPGKPKRVARVAVLVAAAWLASCGGEGPSDPIESSEQDIHQAFDMTVTLPGGTNIQGLGAGSKFWVKAAERTRVEGSTAAADDDVRVGGHAMVGDITAARNVSIGLRTVVDGDVRAGGFVAARGATITGTSQSHVNLGPDNVVVWRVPEGTTSAGPVMVDRDGAANIQPGTYDELRVGDRASITLHTGVYRFERITVARDAKLLIDSRSGPVQIYTKRDVVFRGSVVATTIGIPQFLLGKVGSGHIALEGEFTGALIAPDADIAVHAGPLSRHGHQGRGFGPGRHHDRPGNHGDHRRRGHDRTGHGPRDRSEHRAVVYGKTVWLAPGAVLNSYPFDWGSIAPPLEPPWDPSIPVHRMPQSPLDMPVVVSGGNGSAGAPDTTMTPPAPVTFTLPERYPVSGGIIANGCTTFTFQTPTNQTVACTYCGGSSTSTPNTPIELNRGRTLHFQSCSDGLPPSEPRTGVSFRLHVDPVPDYPVTVNAPVMRDGACSEEFELLSPEQTTEMRESFEWNLGSTLAMRPEVNPDGTPTLYYAWIYIRNKRDALNLRKLFIHVLHRPLFQQELDQFSGRCGTFTNPGNGEGTFVPVLIPGGTYNLLVRLIVDTLLPAPQLPVEGDRDIFEAVILRDDVPPEARNPNGSVRIDALVNANFRYLGYEQHPLPTSGDIQLDSDDVARALVGAVAWAAEAARNIGEFITNFLGGLDCSLRDCIQLTLHVHAETRDYALDSTLSADPTMLRAWGPRRGQHLGAPAMEITVTQDFQDLPIPSTFQASTNHTGKVVVDAVQGGDIRGSGLCIQLRNDAALVTDFLIATELCDFRNLNLDFSRSNERQLQIYSVRLMGMYQADDAFQWSKDVAGFTPPRARIVSGWQADTFTTERDPDGEGPLGEENRLYAPCMSFSSGLREAVLDTSLSLGLLAAIFLPGIPAAYGSVDELLASFSAVVSNTDIMMSTNSSVPNSRLVMSHEYGHYIFCSMLEDEESGSVEEIVELVIAEGDDLSVPLRYTNEAFADFVAGQVAGGANYGWLRRSFNRRDTLNYPFASRIREDYCVRFNSDDNDPPLTSELPCFDDNMRSIPATSADPAGVGRVITLLHDVFDGHPNPLGRNVPGDADLFDHVQTPGPGVLFGAALALNNASYGSTDSALERVALPGSALKRFAAPIARLLDDEGGDALDDAVIFSAVNDAMAGQSWCDRCRVLGLHSDLADDVFPAPGDANLDRPEPTIKQLIQICKDDPIVRDALDGPPPVNTLNIDVNLCQACPPAHAADANGVCQPCADTVQGDQCVICNADAFLDGATMSITTPHVFDPSLFNSPSDTCPEFFWVELTNPQAVFSRGGILSARVDVPTVDQQTCSGLFLLQIAHALSPAAFVTDEVLSANANFIPASGGGTIPLCFGPQVRAFTAAETASGASLRFGTTQQNPFRRLIVSGAPQTPTP